MKAHDQPAPVGQGSDCRKSCRGGEKTTADRTLAAFSIEDDG